MDRAMSGRMLVTVGLLLAGAGTAANGQSATVTVFEGARLINGDASVVENSAFVVQGNRFVGAGRCDARRSHGQDRDPGEFGMIAPGKSADFVVLDANPLDDITNTRRIASVYPVRSGNSASGDAI